jgi:NagD protein
MTAFLVDMDGVLYHGDHVLPGALDFHRHLSQRSHIFITNNPILPPEEVVAKLHALGFGVIDAGLVMTSAQATAAWLGQQKPGFHYFAVGAEGLQQALSRVGKADSVNADYVVVGEGAGLDYESLTTGINLVIERGALLVATNPDTTVDGMRNGRRVVLPGGGALVAPFERATARRAVIIGKPQPLLYRMAMARLGVDADDAIMIGDRPDTDIAGAAALGLKTAVVRSGRFAPGESWPHAIARPDWDVDSLTELTTAFQACGLFN